MGAMVVCCLILIMRLSFVISWPNYFWSTLSSYDYGLMDQCFASFKLEINQRTDIAGTDHYIFSFSLLYGKRG